MALPSWAPTLPQVAVHIPTRTRATTAADYDGDYLGDFTTSTRPTLDQATEHLDQACTWVTATVGTPIASEAEESCRVAAAWRAAWSIELAYQGDGADTTQDAKVLDVLAQAAADALKVADATNRAAGGGTDLDPTPADSLLPAHTFPDPPSWADSWVG